MPIKHTSNSFRNRNDLLFISWGDFPTQGMAEAQVENFQRNGLKAFKENHKSYYRVFVEAVRGREKGLF